MNIKEALEYSYNELSPYSDRQRWEFRNNLKNLEFFVKYVPVGSTVLDVGCGIGISMITLSKLGYKVIGLDKYIFQPNNYLSVKENGLESLSKVWQKNNVSILNEDIFNFVNTTKYDCVMNIAVLEHQKSPKKFIDSCLRNLKQGGLFFCIVPNMVDLLNRCRVMCGRSACRDLKPFFDEGDNFVGHWREYTIKELAQMAEWSGLEIIKAQNSRTSPLFNGKDKFPRNIMLAIFRLLADLVPGSRDTNTLIARYK
ncbi:MAG: hypothetical protein A2725_01185 [Candidatus Magasanikbacteria bacterium RIFCSPHIGHO2_01_FULL_33_34]|uniref:Methyltransferase type 11 domain-containing protein n=1 Tax=Candidatus Magasanikbacteria bacterium RIFCSPHIGHO2_01_FULL_33_34 TaxID=1798671 RepID=A0A1F6LJE8_9BACT|nr:MAG: hypothetical protein A2725_01185 [Candidatus Magasanikbacteria bacterium RIFCSPHIGHO2_01_FULL_33_34]OGH65368.1 MAG: hypothetical protein A3B83_04845 [Candidatus Magasanikbacteria bacterium RIFCSPHIGHO2_02_FULL_33_17]OGH76144.1 MAG: hypothetical protein A3A89_01765 [Candidatus Magasanikbacteria bacterium RIFCSPLOWO2_01_FULL_33_34]OGH81056.1 MAG: hypothetical protein A3F93_02735 [Candidatus Magasanikbacteria bacterium RIFCSPLOWO2_12_FULL_34_7]